jgi:tRNA/rRNA methyltransferase
MNVSLLAATRVVLIHPSLPENVGAVARTMRHFGLAELVLVGGVSPLHSLAIAASAGNEALLRAARVVDDLETALTGVTATFGTTARPQSGIERRALLPAEGARLAASHARSGTVALVFGTEKDGMRTSELRRCDQLLTIPGAAHACLNLAQAFTVLAYEWRLAATTPLEDDLVPLTQVLREAGIDQLAVAVADALAAAGVLKPPQRESKLHALRRVLSGAHLTPDEARMLTGLARGYRREREPERTPEPELTPEREREPGQ